MRRVVVLGATKGIGRALARQIAARGDRVYEVGISYSGRTYQEGKKIGWRDGVRAIWCIFKYRPRRSPAGAVAAKRVPRTAVQPGATDRGRSAA